jgi:hypothetical protein
MVGGVLGEEVFDTRILGEFERVLGAAHDLFQAAEKQHFDTDSLGGNRHRAIVTLEGSCNQQSGLRGALGVTLSGHAGVGHGLGSKPPGQRIVAEEFAGGV